MHLSIEHNETVEIKEKTARSTLKKPNVKRRNFSNVRFVTTVVIKKAI